MAGYDEKPVPRGPSRRWEVVLADERQRGVRHLRALDAKAQHRILQELSDEDLSRIPLLPQGELLSRYGRYLDLHDPARAEFVAEGTEVVEPGQSIVSRSDVPREIWDRLIEAAHDLVGWRRRRSA